MRAHRVIPFLLLATAACSDAPRAVPPSKTPPPANQLPPGHPALDGAAKSDDAKLPPGHPALDGMGNKADTAPDDSQFAGRAILHGELASTTTGALMISVRKAGERLPLWSYKVDLADPNAAKQGLAAPSNGTRELTFVLNQHTTLLPGSIPKDVALEVQVLYDPDGDIDTREGRITAVVPAKIGDTGLVLELGTATSK